MPRLHGTVLLFAVFLALASPSHGQNKSGPVDAAKLPPGKYVGVLKSTPRSDRTFLLEVATQVYVPNLGGIQQRANDAASAARIQVQIAQAQRRLYQGPPQQRGQALDQIRQLQGQLVQTLVSMQRTHVGSYQAVKRTIEFQAAETLEVRTLAPKIEFDDKGNVRKLTREELLERKGADRKLPGYVADLDDLQTGQAVAVYLSSMPKKPKSDEVDLDPALVDRDRPKQVKVVVVQ